MNKKGKVSKLQKGNQVFNFNDSKTNNKILLSILNLTGSQFREARTGYIWSFYVRLSHFRQVNNAEPVQFQNKGDCNNQAWVK